MMVRRPLLHTLSWNPQHSETEPQCSKYSLTEFEERSVAELHTIMFWNKDNLKDLSMGAHHSPMIWPPHIPYYHPTRLPNLAR
jgi:hypothetical protein